MDSEVEVKPGIYVTFKKANETNPVLPDNRAIPPQTSENDLESVEKDADCQGGDGGAWGGGAADGVPGGAGPARGADRGPDHTRSAEKEVAVNALKRMIAKLVESNEEMREFDPNDPDLVEAIRENEHIIEKKRRLLRELEESDGGML